MVIRGGGRGPYVVAPPLVALAGIDDVATIMMSRMTVLGNDLRYALRRLRLAPGVAATIVLTLALGVGANAAVFSLADRLFLQPPPGIADPQSLRRIYARSNWSVGEVTEIHDEIGYPQFDAIASALGTRAQLTAYTRPDSVVIGDEEARSTVQGSYVDTAFFHVLRVRMALGRPFATGEATFDSPDLVAIISY